MKTVTILVVLLALALNANTGLQAQSSKYNNITVNSLETLNQGIKSENSGLRRSSIYMAGLYKIDEAVSTLKYQLVREKDPGIRILIALSLYNIGNPDGMESVRNLAKSDNDTEVKRMSTALYIEFINDNNE